VSVRREGLMSDDNSIFENDSDADDEGPVELPRGLPLRPVPPSPQPPSPPVRQTPGASPVTPPFSGATVLPFRGRGMGEGDPIVGQTPPGSTQETQTLPPETAAPTSASEEPVPTANRSARPLWPLIAGAALVGLTLWIDWKTRRGIAELAAEYEED
jgi:hypothetical protein